MLVVSSAPPGSSVHKAPNRAYRFVGSLSRTTYPELLGEGLSSQCLAA
ncbi:hypothetical protein Ptr902_01451 [Pyrenophora tritici-repentis]|nr:hypothetical protein Ptr902_01451 [Pyrenophora tritici-repentis]